MIIPVHLNIPFKLSDNAIKWFDIHKDAIYNEFDSNFPEQAGFVFNNPAEIKSILFQSTLPAIEVKNFLANLGLTNTYVHYMIYKPNIYENSMKTLHIDAPQFVPLPARFNILIEGNTFTRMHWWNHGVDSDKVKLEYIDAGGKRWKVPGNTSREQIEIIGMPDYSSGSLSVAQHSADFVKTDIIHCLENDGERRFILSARIHHSWTEVYEKINKVFK